jgi:hypothetical protein
MIAAMIDRLVHHSHLLVFHGESWRVKNSLVNKKIPQQGREKFFAKIGNFYLQKKTLCLYQNLYILQILYKSLNLVVKLQKFKGLDLVKMLCQ